MNALGELPIMMRFLLFLGVCKAVAAQCLGGIFFSIFAGQPLIVVMTTAPLTIYVKGKMIDRDEDR